MSPPAPCTPDGHLDPRPRCRDDDRKTAVMSRAFADPSGSRLRLGREIGAVGSWRRRAHVTDTEMGEWKERRQVAESDAGNLRWATVCGNRETRGQE